MGRILKITLKGKKEIKTCWIKSNQAKLVQMKLKYFGHNMGAEDSLEEAIAPRRTHGKRRRRKPRKMASRTILK